MTRLSEQLEWLVNADCDTLAKPVPGESKRAEERTDGTRRRRYRWLDAAVLSALILTALGVALALGPFRDDGSGGEDSPVETGRQSRRIDVTVAPLYEAAGTLKGLEPVTEHLGRLLSVEVVLTKAQTSHDAIESLVKGRTDLGVIPALACVQAREHDREVKLIALQSFDNSFATDTLLVVRKADPTPSLQKLRGGTLCVADTSSTAYLMARAWLRSHGIDPVDFLAPRAEGGQLEALRALVADGAGCDVAAIDRLMLAAAPQHGIAPEAVEVLVTTGHGPLPCWAASPRLEEHLCKNLTRALLTFDPAARGRAHHARGPLQVTGFRDVDGTTFRALRHAAQLEGMLRPR